MTTKPDITVQTYGDYVDGDGNPLDEATRAELAARMTQVNAYIAAKSLRPARRGWSRSMSEAEKIAALAKDIDQTCRKSRQSVGETLQALGRVMAYGLSTLPENEVEGQLRILAEALREYVPYFRQEARQKVSH